MPIKDCEFKKGDRVSHINGGSGIIKDTYNNWRTTPPTVMAVVCISGVTAFSRTRRVAIADLRKED